MQTCIRRKSSLEKDIKGLKEEKSVKMNTFKTLQFNITGIFDINSSNKCFVQYIILLVKLFHLIYAIAI